MTEAEWLRSDRIDQMLNYLSPIGGPRVAGAERRLRLFGVACCRVGWDLIADHPEVRACVEFAELGADGQAAEKLRGKVVADCYRWRSRQRTRSGDPFSGPPAIHEFARLARDLCRYASTTFDWPLQEVGRILSRDYAFGLPAQASLLRCVFGNPFRPVVFDPSWRSETAVALATGIYAERAFDRMPILADALEEARCDHPDVLTHCREPNGVHARGCWVIDGVLGK